MWLFPIDLMRASCLLQSEHTQEKRHRSGGSFSVKTTRKSFLSSAFCRFSTTTEPVGVRLVCFGLFYCSRAHRKKRKERGTLHATRQIGHVVFMSRYLWGVLGRNFFCCSDLQWCFVAMKLCSCLVVRPAKRYRPKISASACVCVCVRACVRGVRVFVYACIKCTKKAKNSASFFCGLGHTGGSFFQTHNIKR